MNKGILYRENLTQKNKEKILNILQKTIKNNDNVRILKNEFENGNLQSFLKDNLQYKYIILGNYDKNLLKQYFETNFVSDLQQFLKQKNYNLTKSPKKITRINNNNVEFGFLNLMEVDNTTTILSKHTVHEFEQFLIEKLKLIFDLDLQQKFSEDISLNSVLQQQKQTKKLSKNYKMY